MIRDTKEQRVSGENGTIEISYLGFSQNKFKKKEI